MSPATTHDVRTYKTRRRRLSPARAAAHATLLHQWGLEVRGPELDLRSLRPEGCSEVVLDLGVGGGESTIHAARLRPDQLVVAVEVHTPGIAAVLSAIDQAGWGHVRVVEGDALAFLGRLVPASVDEVRVFFPDPWPKRRHHRRRLVRPDVIDRLVTLLRPEGRIHLATDDAAYAEAMQRHCDAHPLLDGGLVPRPSQRALTRYEQRGLDAGRDATDLVYVTR